MDLENKELKLLAANKSICTRSCLKVLASFPRGVHAAISCECKTKCVLMRFKRSKASLKCTPACRFGAIGFPNLTCPDHSLFEYTDKHLMIIQQRT